MIVTVLLTVIAVILAVWGVLAVLNGSIFWGFFLLVLACAIGPGGWTIYGRRRV